MYKVEKLYVVWGDGDGHRYLIPKEDYSGFESCVDNLEEVRGDIGEDCYYDELNTILDELSHGILEGDLHYVVLEDDVIDKDIKEK